MASPSVRSTNTSTASGSGNHAVSYPGTMSTGDTCVCVFAVDGSPTLTWPSAGDDIWNSIFDTAANGVKLAIAWHEVTGGEGASFNVNVSVSEVSGHCTYCIQAASDPDTAPPEVSAGATAATGNADPDSITAGLTGYDNMFIACAAVDRRTITGYPTNCPDSQITAGAGGSQDASAGMASDQLTQDTFNPDNFTNVSDGWVAATVVVYPTGAAPPTGQPWQIRDTYPLPASLGFGPG